MKKHQYKIQRKDEKTMTLNQNEREIWSQYHRRTIHNLVGHLSAHSPKWTLIKFCQIYVSN